MKRLLWLVCALLCALLLAACGAKPTMTGRYLRAENGISLIVAEDGGPIQLSDLSKSGNLFIGLNSGDRIEIQYDAIAETYPGQTGVYACKLLEEGTPEDVPEETLASLEELGWKFHSHAPAEEPQSVEAPVTGYCGNTVTTIHLGGQTYSFWGSDSVTLTDILINLVYDPGQVCRCLPEFTVDTEFGGGYGVNLTESYVRCESGQSALTAEQTTVIRDILERNCG